MDPNSWPADAGPAPVELIVQNGRQRGSCHPLHQPLTLVGRAAGCDVRLNAAGISPHHCALVLAPRGLLLRILSNTNITQVNGQQASNGFLSDGDLLTVGPFQFQVRVHALPAAETTATTAAVAEEKEALRVQAAAVAAQQAALGEEEAKLQQRRAALEQQEEQLAKHLEEKRQRLIEVRDQAREAYTQLRTERKLREAQLADGRGELLAMRREVEDGWAQLRLDRQRLLGLRRRLKQRWHRHWAAERASLVRHEGQLAARQQEVEREAERLGNEREALRNARLAFNGETEIGRRQLQAAWDKLRKSRNVEDDRQTLALGDLADRQAALDGRAAALAEAERSLDDELRQWQALRGDLEKESVGLENRVRNYRRKITDHSDELQRLEAQLVAARARVEEPQVAAGPSAESTPATEAPGPEVAPESATVAEPATAAPPASLPVPLARPELARIAPVAVAVPVLVATAQTVPADVALSLTLLERLAGELADQRLHLLEQCQRLVEAQRRWQDSRDVAAIELEALGRRLYERELAVERREESLEAAEVRVRQQHREANNLQRYLEGWQTRMTARESGWEADRERLLADLQGREKLAEQRLQAIDGLHGRWKRRRHREVEWLKTERSACEKLRRECAGLRDGLMKRQAALEQEQRALAEKSLALEQLQQESLGQAADAAAAGRRLERLRRRWASLSVTAEKAITEQRQALQNEATRLEELQRGLHKQTGKITAQESELAQRLSEWERNQLVATDEMNRVRQDLASAQTLRDRYEKQVLDLRDEVEQMARLFLDDGEPLSLPKAQAA